jgi:hypothetical protein
LCFDRLAPVCGRCYSTMPDGLEIGGDFEKYRAIVAHLKRPPHQKALCDREAITCAASLERAP